MFLDTLAKKLGTDRSRLIEQALRSFILDHAHYFYPHRCRGVLIVYRENKGIDVIEALEEFRDIVSSYSHHHVDGFCLEMIVVSGNSSRVSKLHRRLAEVGCRVRYVPLRTDIDLDELRKEIEAQKNELDQRSEKESHFGYDSHNLNY